MYQEALKQAPDNVDSLGRLGGCYAKAGRRNEAERVLKQLQEMSSRRYVPQAYFAQIYGNLGDLDQAFKWLEKAYDDKNSWLPMLQVDDDMFASLRAAPRYNEIVQRVGLSEKRNTHDEPGLNE